MLKELIKIANELDQRGLRKEADELDQLIKEVDFEPGSNRERKRLNRIGRFIIKALRHKPEELGITLDRQGWVEIDVLLDALRNKNQEITREELEYLVAISDKQRFAIDELGEKIRANQGHSIDVDLGYESQTPPEYLYHGTNEESIDDILETGVQRMKRHAVHLSDNLDTAIKVGRRRGKLLILRVESGKMYEDGYTFYLSDNNVWLTNHIPIQYIKVYPNSI
jgi:putative RNA 2'-phosphotransferase